jgi:tripartite-type tricarboxylate transporter receptor subunit TctC
MKRRQLLASATALLGTALPLVCAAQAQYPTNPVKVLVGFPPGTAADMAARAVTESMGRRLGQPFVVDNRSGAASNIAAKAVATSPADGYTLFASTIANTINAAFPNSQSVDPLKDFVPITLIGNVPNVLVVHPSVPAASVADLVRLAKAKPGSLSYASSGIGTSPHLSGELFATMTGAKIVHVPYRGSTPAVTDLLGGQVQFMFAPASSVLPHVKAGKLKALAVTSAQRSAAVPELPTIAEAGPLPGFDASSWFGLLAPAGTPKDVIAKLNTEFNKALQNPELRKKLGDEGADAAGGTPEQFAAMIRDEIPRWGKVVKESGARID